MAARVSRRRWPLIGLAAYGLAVAFVLLAPISYGAIVAAIGAWLADGIGLVGFGTGWVEFVANIIMFAPLGFLLTLLVRSHWVGAALAVVLSIAAEAAQIVIPSREPSLRDILANATGAIVGATLAWIVLRRELSRGTPASPTRSNTGADVSEGL